MMRGIVNIIEAILEKPETWGTLSLSHEELENLRKYHRTMTKDVSDEQAKFLLNQIDLLDIAPQMYALLSEIRDYMMDGPSLTEADFINRIDDLIGEEE